jgi:hypothetical protein
LAATTTAFSTYLIGLRMLDSGSWLLAFSQNFLVLAFVFNRMATNLQ